MTRRRTPRALLGATVALCCALVAPAVHAEVERLWAISDGDKVRRGDLDHPGASGNAVYDPETQTVRLFGLRNETVAFQVVVQGGKAPTDALEIDLPAVGAIANRGVSDDPDRYYLGRHIEIFEVHEVEVEKRSHDLVWLPGSDAEPAVELGPVPDPLTPHRRPVAVPARKNQVFWIDVWIPRDSPTGLQSGTIQLRSAGSPCGDTCELRVELEVAEQALPDTPAVKTMLYFSGGEPERDYVLGRYFADSPTAEEREALMRRHHFLARRHRVTLFWGKHDRPDTIAERLRGDLYTADSGYQGPGEGNPENLLVLEAYGGELSADEARQWRRWLDENAPEARALLYVVDEPKLSPANIERINEVAAVAEPIDSFVTTPFDPRIRIDVFAALASDFRRKAARAARKAGAEQWIYNGVRPHTGSFAIDDVAISPRVNPWIQLESRIPRWFYWEGTYYFDFQGERGAIDVWKQAGNFSNRQGDFVNGDGLLFYPGTDHFFPDSSQGVARPLPSIRLKNWRRGIEDAGYVELARAMGKTEEADAIVTALVGASLDRRRPDEPPGWPEDGDSWFRARRRLFDAITGGEQTVSLGDIRRPSEGWGVRLAREARHWGRVLFGSPRRIAASVTVAALGALSLGFLLWRRRRRRSRGD